MDGGCGDEKFIAGVGYPFYGTGGVLMVLAYLCGGRANE